MVLEQRYGSRLADRHRSMFAEAGLAYAERLEKIPNSRNALTVAELSRDRGLFDQLHPRVFDAFWARGRDIGDPQVLVEEGTAVGLDAGEIVDALQDGRYLERVQDQTRAAIELGAGGVPAWLVDERVLVPGAQPHDVFEHFMGRLGHPPLE